MRVLVAIVLCAQLLRADEAPSYRGQRVGNGYLAFGIGNRTDDWGCLGSVHIVSVLPLTVLYQMRRSVGA